MTVSPEWVLTIFLGVTVPIMLFFWRLSSKQNSAVQKLDELTHMHNDDDHQFSTVKTNQLLEQSIVENTEMHRASMGAAGKLTQSIDQLSHYTQWLGKAASNGKGPPPFVAKP